MSAGWEWDSPWEVELSPYVDKEGWAYAPDWAAMDWPPQNGAQVCTDNLVCVSTAPSSSQHARQSCNLACAHLFFVFRLCCPRSVVNFNGMAVSVVNAETGGGGLYQTAQVVEAASPGPDQTLPPGSPRPRPLPETDCCCPPYNLNQASATCRKLSKDLMSLLLLL